ncbi:MAG TPA: hypothetical protein VMB71_01465 [Acetobacteraceae bacterium]|nr:hypothetical protein [Acetobacteraceae bacterium]
MIDVAAPAKRLLLELLVGETVVAHLMPDQPRDDIAKALGRPVSPGFVFEAETLALAAEMAASPDDPILVRIAGTDLTLASVRAARAGEFGAAEPEPAPSPRVPHAARAAVDRILLLPGFGCLAEGWVLSPQKRVAKLGLDFGGLKLPASPQAVYGKPRPDLAAAFPGSDHLAASAGFAAYFPEQDGLFDASDPNLTVEFADGTATIFPLEQSAVRLLGHAASVEDALPFFPGLAAEPFFPRFATAALAARRAAIQPPEPLTLVATPRTLVAVLPNDRDDRFLLFETLAAQCRKAPLPGLTLIAAAAASRPDATWMLRDFARDHQVPCSLFIAGETADAFAVLADILTDVQAKRFAFLADGIFPTDAGWDHIRAYLNGSATSLMFLGIAGETEPSARAFAWTAEKFCPFAAGQPAYLEGFHGDNGLNAADPKARFHAACARQARPFIPGMLAAEINAVAIEA